MKKIEQFLLKQKPFRTVFRHSIENIFEQFFAKVLKTFSYSFSSKSSYRIINDVGEVIHVGGDAGQHGRRADECVIERNDGRQVGDLEEASKIAHLPTILY